LLSLLKLDVEDLASLHRPPGSPLSSAPAVFEDLGHAAALNWQLQEFESRTGTRCRRRGFSRSAALAAAPSLALFRIFQEILTNVIRHANATTLAVAVETEGDWFTLRVSDNGQGFDPNLLSSSRSLGLLGMRERAGLYGGAIEWSSRPTGGTTVTVRLPIGGNL
jgi:signal transduction histidine kinase